eukprot:5487766-Amphidinium_carterae.1
MPQRGIRKSRQALEFLLFNDWAYQSHTSPLIEEAKQALSHLPCSIPSVLVMPNKWSCVQSLLQVFARADGVAIRVQKVQLEVTQ